MDLWRLPALAPVVIRPDFGPPMAQHPGALYALVYTEELSILESNQPSFAAIQAALRQAGMDAYRGDPHYGAWVGPAPRVTRVAQIGRGFRTRVAWLWEWPDPALYNARPVWMRARLESQVDGALATVSGDFDQAQLLPYDPGVNGATAWWEDGANGASHTATRDDPAEGLARLGPVENATGPNNPDAVAPGQLPPGVGGQLTTFADKAIAGLKAFGLVLGAGALVGGVYYGGKALSERSKT